VVLMSKPVWIPEERALGIPTLEAFAGTWQTERLPEWKRSHARTVGEALDFWVLPSIGDRPLDAIARADLLAFRAWMHSHDRHPSAARINKVVGVLAALLREGTQRYGCPDPTIGLKALQIVEPDIHPFSLAQMEAILGALEPRWADYFSVRFLTGLRTGEADGLMWADVDLQGAMLSVNRAWVDGARETPKTRAGRRDVVLVAPVVAALERQHDRTGRGSMVFCSRNGTPLNRRNVTRRTWYPVLDALGLTRRRAYQTRHTYATLMLAAGENVEFIRRQMGHSDARMLFTRYARFVPNLTRQDGTAFGALVRGIA
jgi:integrase